MCVCVSMCLCVCVLVSNQVLFDSEFMCTTKNSKKEICHLHAHFKYAHIIYYSSFKNNSLTIT